MSDPYNPFEREYRLTRGAMELIAQYGFGMAIATKSDLIIRDVDVLNDIARHSPVIVKITITAADDTLCSKVEPNVCVSSDRFKAIKRLSDEGIYVGVLLMPVLPFIEDNTDNIASIVELAHQNGAKFIYPNFGMTLRQNQRDWYYNKLDELFPSLKQKYIKSYGNSYGCHSPKANELWSVFRSICDKYGITYKMNDIIRQYKAPYENTQLSFLE